MKNMTGGNVVIRAGLLAVAAMLPFGGSIVRAAELAPWRAMIPRPVSLAAGQVFFTLTADTVLVADAASRTTAAQLAGYLGNGVWSILALMALGIPLYVCASASVPIAAGLLHLGASPGAALAFLIAGPATNAATIATIWKLLGGRTAVLYLLTIALSAVGGGLILDWLMPAAGGAMPHLAAHVHETVASARL